MSSNIKIKVKQARNVLRVRFWDKELNLLQMA